MSHATILSKDVTDMWTLVNLQHQKALTAFLSFDQDLAREVILIEERVDSSEQMIDADCEYFLTCRETEGPGIPFVMHVMKINRQLERIGDIAEGIVTDILAAEEPFSADLVEEVRIVDLYRKCIRMLELGLEAFDNEDLKMAQLVLSRVEVFQDLSMGVNDALIGLLQQRPEQLKESLHIFSMVKGLDNLAEHVRTLAEELLCFAQKTMVPDGDA